MLPRPLKIGDTVLIFDIDKQATVIGLPKNSDQVEVQAGIMKTRVPLSNLRLMQQEKSENTSAYFQKRCEDGQSSCQGSS